jgi:Tol biopolymer transport system component
VIQSNGEGLKNLTEIHNIHHPAHFAWSPDGSQIAFIDCSWMEPERKGMLYVIRRDGSDLISMEELFNAQGVSVECSPISWSPDGQGIAFRAGPTREEFSDILLVSAGGDAVKNLTKGLLYEDIRACEGVASSFLDTCLRDLGFEQVPVWAPDGSALAVLVDNEIYLISIDGHSYRRLTDQPGTPYPFEWTPNSRHIIYCNVDGDGQIYAVSVDTGEIRRISEGSEPDLSPDGNRIVFSRAATGIYTVDFSGENLDHIVAGLDYYAPRWIPESQFISLLKFAGGKQTVSIVPGDGSWEKVVVEIGALWNGQIAWSK